MDTKHYLFFVAAFFSTTLYPLSQQPGMHQHSSAFEDAEAPRSARKSRSIFISPSKNNPADQLEYARQLTTKGKLSSAASAYRALVHQWHDTAEAATAQEAYARILEERGNYKSAFTEYQYLIEKYTGSFDYARIIQRQFSIANLVWRQRSEYALDFGGYSSLTALDMFNKIVENAPNSDLAPEAQFLLGQIHETRKEYEQAVMAYELVRERYSNSPFAHNATFRRANCLYAIANLAQRDEERQKLAFRALALFRREFPGSEHDEDAAQKADELIERLENMAFRRASFYDKRKKNSHAAILAYERFLKEFPRSERRAFVENRIRELAADK